MESRNNRTMKNRKMLMRKLGKAAKAEDSHARMKMCKVELKKAPALLRKGKKEGGETNQSDLEGARKRDSGKSSEGGQRVYTDEVKKEPPKRQGDDNLKARRGAATKTLP